MVIRRSGYQVVGIRIQGIRFKDSFILTFPDVLVL